MNCNEKTCYDPSHFWLHGRMMYRGTKIEDLKYYNVDADTRK